MGVPGTSSFTHRSHLHHLLVLFAWHPKKMEQGPMGTQEEKRALFEALQKSPKWLQFRKGGKDLNGVDPVELRKQFEVLGLPWEDSQDSTVLFHFASHPLLSFIFSSFEVFPFRRKAGGFWFFHHQTFVLTISPFLLSIIISPNPLLLHLCALTSEGLKKFLPPLGTGPPPSSHPEIFERCNGIE